MDSEWRGGGVVTRVFSSFLWNLVIKAWLSYEDGCEGCGQDDDFVLLINDLLE